MLLFPQSIALFYKTRVFLLNLQEHILPLLLTGRMQLVDTRELLAHEIPLLDELLLDVILLGLSEVLLLALGFLDLLIKNLSLLE